MAGPRSARVERRTAEVAVTVELDLDGAGAGGADTGVAFLDHMLAQLGKHARFDLRVQAKGDLQVDAHHTVEDTGIALGTAIARALGDRAGIRRYGDALVPLDGSPEAESVLEPVMDLVGADNASATCTLLLVQQPIAAIALSSLEAAIPPEARPDTDDGPTVAYLNSVAERLRSRGIRVHTRATVHTSPARAILDQAHESEADLIAMATHGRGGIRRLLIGSVADKVLRGTDRPVLLYRAGA